MNPVYMIEYWYFSRGKAVGPFLNAEHFATRKAAGIGAAELRDKWDGEIKVVKYAFQT